MVLFCLSFYTRADNSVVDRIVAVVNGEIITLSDVENYIFTLGIGSPLIDSGIDTVFTLDIEGNLRPSSSFDIGVYEY